MSLSHSLLDWSIKSKVDNLFYEQLYDLNQIYKGLKQYEFVLLWVSIYKYFEMLKHIPTLA